jgi:hypothetical protein
LPNSPILTLAIILFFGCVPLVLGAFLNRLPTWKMRGLGFLGLCLLGLVVYTLFFVLFDNPRGAQAFAWWLVGLGMTGPFWCGAAAVGLLVGGFLRRPAA